MIVSSHIKASGILGLGVYACTGEFIPSIACFLSGWLIDIDHFLDWVMNFGLTSDYARVASNFRRNRHRRLYVILHGWEYVVGLLTLYVAYGLPLWAAYATMGYISHLTLDQVFNGPKRPLTYFLTYRIFHKFNSSFFLMRSNFSPPMSVRKHAVNVNFKNP